MSRADPVFPIYVSVDTEFTAGNLHAGECMQIGAAVSLPQIEPDGSVDLTWCTDLPISPEAKVTPWVQENLGELVVRCRALWDEAGGQLPDPPNPRARARYGLRRRKLVTEHVRSWMIEFKMWLLGMQVHYRARLLHEGVVEGDPAADVDYEAAFPLVFVAYTGAYDFGFVELLFRKHGLPNPFHYEMVDISSMLVGLGFGWDADHGQVCQILKVPRPPEEERHDALVDAQHQLALYLALERYRVRHVPALVEARIFLHGDSTDDT